MSWRRFNFRQGPPAWSSGLRPLGKCSTQKPGSSAVVVIDEDDDGGASDSEVFIVDDAAGKTCPTTSRCQAKKGDGFSGNVINLDDDDDDDVEVEEVSRGAKAGPSTAGGAGSPAATTPGLVSPRNRYGLDCTSDSFESVVSEGSETDSQSVSESESDDSTSDCEIMDDTCGTARKMWETAASSRKKMPNGVHKGKEGIPTASASSSGSETQPGKNGEDLFGSECHLDEDIFWFFDAADYNWNGRHFSDAWKGEQQSSSPGAKDGRGPSTVPDAEECLNGNVSNGKETDHVQNSNGDAKDSRTECPINEEVFQDFSHADKEDFSHADKEGAQNTTGTSKVDCDPSSGQNANKCSNGNVSNRKGPDSSASPALDSDTPRDDKTAHFHNGAEPEKASDGIQSPHLDETFVGSFVSGKRVFPARSPYWKYGSPPMSVGTPEKMDERIDQSPPDAHNVTSESCSLSQKDVVDDPTGLGQLTLVQEASDFQDGLVGEREKHKETAEFKRAAEEEWASRQRQLKIQAEEAKEAKKLRKRKKAEALRLLEMEKKQKQRLEEVRESQKKNEEEIQLKEQYRCVVRKELEDTERRYRDTPSILRVLGIQGGEVRTALKQAQVKFHPDKFSRSDIYQQVKAEETFKFISRLKENLPRLP